MGFLLVLFGVLAAALWLSVFGYLIALGCIAWCRRTTSSELALHPEVAILGPVLTVGRGGAPSVAGGHR